jgi:hypothetical protein
VRRADLPSYADGRGTLVPIELAALAEAGFDTRRVFTVVGPPGGAWRGDHALTCRELIVLAAGSATVEVAPGPDAPGETTVLDVPGRALEVGPRGWLRYHLPDDRSVVLVLADAAYSPEEESR